MNPSVNGQQQPAPAPFVVGVSRSGTTLLRLMLDAHPELAIPAETRFLPAVIDLIEAGAGASEVAEAIIEDERFGDFGLLGDALRSRVGESHDPAPADAVRAFFELYAAAHGKSRWGDKSPPYVLAIEAIASLLPEAVFIHLIRDGRDVAASLLKRDWGMRRAAVIARRWCDEVSAGRRDGNRLGPGRYLELRYETLVIEPEATLRLVCDATGLGFDPAMLNSHLGAAGRLAELGDLPGGRSAAERTTQFTGVLDPISSARVGSWRRTLDPADLASFEAIAGPLLAELGYPTQ